MQARLGWPTWIGVVADDMEGMAGFYEALGLPRIHTGKDWIQLDLGGHTLEILERSDKPEYGERRFQVGFDVDDVEAARAALLEAGATAITEIEGNARGTNRWCYLRDPEGNVFEITQRRRPTAEAG
jgi:predicted enzyme related to lactoylglutathione lyase